MFAITVRVGWTCNRVESAATVEGTRWESRDVSVRKSIGEGKDVRVLVMW